MTSEERELVELYCADTQLPERVVSAFVRAGIEPPTREVVDRIGYTFTQVAVIGA